MGTDPGVGEGPGQGKTADQRQVRDRRRATDLPGCLPQTTLPHPRDGFYEWKQEGGRKQPVYICMKDQEPFAFAGLWERWVGEEDDFIESCTILTTEPNELLEPIHNRIPVILDPNEYQLSLHPHVHHA